LRAEKHDAFISYSRADARHAAEIDSVLHQKGLQTLSNCRSLVPGLHWVPALEETVGATKAAIILLGPSGLGNTQYVDQWEEPLYAHLSSMDGTRPLRQRPGDATRFIDWLLNATRSAPVPAVGTVRADFYDPLNSHPEIRALLPGRQVFDSKHNV
jgi:hypothetical protein